MKITSALQVGHEPNPKKEWELCSNGIRIATCHCLMTPNSMGGFTPNLGSAERSAKEIMQAVNEHAALVAVAEAASDWAIREIWQATRSIDLEKNMVAALANLAAVRGQNGGAK